MIPSKPLFFITPADPMFMRWKPLLDEWQAKANVDIPYGITVPEKDVSSRPAASTTSILELLHALQHYPDLIPRLLQNLDIRFARVDFNVYDLHDNSWIDKPHIEWLRLLGNGVLFPLAVFFIKDPAMRYFSLVGDLVLKHRYTGPFEQRIINERVYNAGRHLLLYCHGQDIMVDRYIKTLMLECKVTFGYAAILRAHRTDVKAGLPFRYERFKPYEGYSAAPSLSEGAS